MILQCLLFVVDRQSLLLQPSYFIWLLQLISDDNTFYRKVSISHRALHILINLLLRTTVAITPVL